MKKVILPLIVVFCSWTLTAAISPKTCDQHLQSSDCLVEGIVKNISVELDCWSERCNFYSLKYVADMLITDVMKGDDLAAGQIIKVSYLDNFQYPLEGEYPMPGFQGHNPLPNQWEYWAVFVNKNGNTFDVAPPNGWWNYSDDQEHCWK